MKIKYFSGADKMKVNYSACFRFNSFIRTDKPDR